MDSDPGSPQPANPEDAPLAKTKAALRNDPRVVAALLGAVGLAVGSAVGQDVQETIDQASSHTGSSHASTH